MKWHWDIQLCMLSQPLMDRQIAWWCVDSTSVSNGGCKSAAWNYKSQPRHAHRPLQLWPRGSRRVQILRQDTHTYTLNRQRKLWRYCWSVFVTSDNWNVDSHCCRGLLDTPTLELHFIKCQKCTDLKPSTKQKTMNLLKKAVKLTPAMVGSTLKNLWSNWSWWHTHSSPGSFWGRV